ncbi:MAG: hypothetical protein GOVbin5978_27 [Prokaryotic dsDNA virus sp.]|nr:MAG: hypothetical protein GOVbin5978_27 [Prokaryotic dsDNA virus sp.]
MSKMKEKFIEERELEEYEEETLRMYYSHLLLLSEEEEWKTIETINAVKEN